MAFENLFTRKPNAITLKVDGGQDLEIKLDGVIDESFDYTATVTKNPVENGQEVIDNIIINPRKYTMNAVVTDTPIGLAAWLPSGGGSIGGVFGSTGLFGKSTAGVPNTRSKQMFQVLLEIFEARQLVSVQTALDLYDDLVIESINTVADADRANAVFFTAVFAQVLVPSASNDNGLVPASGDQKSIGSVGEIHQNQPIGA